MKDEGLQFAHESERLGELWRSQGEDFLAQQAAELIADVDRLRVAFLAQAARAEAMRPGHRAPERGPVIDLRHQDVAGLDCQRHGNVVAAGHKVGFCLEDAHSWSSNANPQVKYDCNYQGIQAGWADVYAAGLPCQYIDITGVPPGDYVLRLAINPAGLLPEADTNNNVTLVAPAPPVT